MSKIISGKWNLFSDNQVSDAGRVSDNIYKPDTGGDSLEHINGHLDSQNLPAAADPEHWFVSGDVVQDNTFTGASMVGSTGNADFFRDPLFQDVWRHKIFGPDEPIGGDPGEDDFEKLRREGDSLLTGDTDFIPIPGAGVEFYLPYDCTLVLITWNVHFDDDGDQGKKISKEGDHQFGTQAYAGRSLESKTDRNTRTWLRFYIDDAWVEGQERITFPLKSRPSSESSLPDPTLYLPGGELNQGRYWNGHHAAAVSNGTGLTKGWHSAGLRIFSNSKQARVRVRGIRHVYFR